MSINHNKWIVSVIKMSLILLMRYQHISLYIITTPLLLFITSFSELRQLANHVIIILNTNLILWIFIPFIINQLNFSPDDFKSLILFPIKWYQFLLARNIVLSSILLLSHLLSFIVIGLVYDSIFNFAIHVTVYNLVLILPIVSMGNLITIGYFRRNKDILFYTKILITIFITNFNLGIFIIGEKVFNKLILYLFLFLLLHVYLILYKISLNRSVRIIVKSYGKYICLTWC